MLCWVNGEKCPYGFERGIFGARMSFCRGCSQFLLNREEICEKMVNLERDKFFKSFISKEDQDEICEEADVLVCIITERISDLNKRWEKRERGTSQEISILESLKDVFLEYA